MRTDLFDFHLPEELIALRPVVPRDGARLLLVEPRAAPPIADLMVLDLPALLAPGDALVFNDTKVIPAELDGVRRRDEGAARVAVTLIERLGPDRWQALARPAKRLKAGDRIRFGAGSETCLTASLAATVAARGDEGEATLVFDLAGAALDEAIHSLGNMPLPPYIASRRHADAQDRSDYQTVFAREEGAVAAPTAGLHFTERLLRALADGGISEHFVTLHVGPGTFLPVRRRIRKAHRMHAEHGSVSARNRRRLERGEGPGRADRRRRHDVAAAFGKRRGRGRTLRLFNGATETLHHAGLSLSLRRSPA